MFSITGKGYIKKLILNNLKVGDVTIELTIDNEVFNDISISEHYSTSDYGRISLSDIQFNDKFEINVIRNSGIIAMYGYSIYKLE